MKTKHKFKIENKRGWMKIIEAFSAILIIWIVLLTIINKNDIREHDISTKAYNGEILVLRMIQLNTTLREQVISSTNLPLNSLENNFPSEVNSTITTKIPVFLSCLAQICTLENDCTFESQANLPKDKDIYVQGVIITSTASTYAPKNLKLFCWMKN